MPEQKCRQMGFSFPRLVRCPHGLSPGPHETTHNARFHRLSRRFSSLFPIRVTRGYARVDPRTGVPRLGARESGRDIKAAINERHARAGKKVRA